MKRRTRCYPCLKFACGTKESAADEKEHKQPESEPDVNLSTLTHCACTVFLPCA